MSFASILGPSNNEASPKLSEAKQPPTKIATPPSLPVADSKPVPEKPVKLPELNSSRAFGRSESKTQSKMDVVHVQRRYVPPPPPRTKATNEELEKISKALNDIDENHFSDVEDSGWAEHMDRYMQKSRKRAAVVYEGEVRKRKVRTQLCCLAATNVN
jgi:hypothetical protein